MVVGMVRNGNPKVRAFFFTAEIAVEAHGRAPLLCRHLKKSAHNSRRGQRPLRTRMSATATVVPS